MVSRKEVIEKNFGGHRTPNYGGTVGYNNLGGMDQFFANFLVLLTQAFDPSKADGDFSKGFMGLLMKAFGFENETDLQDLHDDIQKNGRDAARDKVDFGKMDRSAASRAIAEGAELLVQRAPKNPSERQTRVINSIGDAADTAGVSKEFMVGLWGFESSYGQNRKSNTGCLGDFQFTRLTMVDTLAKDGDKIVARLQARGLTNEAKLVQDMHNQTKAMTPAQIRQFAKSNTEVVDALRDNSEISTYAAAFHTRSVADQLKIDARQKSNFGLMYAGYNIGVDNARKIMNGQKAEGWEVTANAGVAQKGSAAEQANSYQRAIERGIAPSIVDRVNTAQQAERTIVSAATQTEKPAASTTKLSQGLSGPARPLADTLVLTPPEGAAGAPQQKPAPEKHAQGPQLAMLSMA